MPPKGKPTSSQASAAEAETVKKQPQPSAEKQETAVQAETVDKEDKK